MAKANKALRAPDRATKAAGAKETAARKRAETDHAAEVEGLQRLVTDLETKVKKAGEEVRRLRRSSGDAEARAVEAQTGPGWLGTDPIDLARHLDDLMARSRRVGATDPGPVLAEERLQLPAGVGPDSPEAIDAVARMGGRVAVIVDGYNAGLALGPGTAAEVRSRLEPHLRRLRSLGGSAMTVTVVWDSKAEQQGSRKPGGGIEVVFAPAGVEADDVVVNIAARRSRCVVITNDRAVRERAERTGALALWSDALVAWARKRG
jgi:hypothetical protein